MTQNINLLYLPPALENGDSLRHRTRKRKRIASAFRIKKLEKREHNLLKQIETLHEEKDALFARLKAHNELSTLIERAHEGEPKCLVKILEQIPHFDRLIHENRRAAEELALELTSNGGVEGLALRVFSSSLGEKLVRAWPKLQSAEEALNKSEAWFERAIDAVEVPKSLEEMGRTSNYAERRKTSSPVKKEEIDGTWIREGETDDREEPRVTSDNDGMISQETREENEGEGRGETGPKAGKTVGDAETSPAEIEKEAEQN